MTQDKERTFGITNVIGILALVATALTFGATLLGAVSPQYAVYALAVAAAINAFTGRVQGTPPDAVEKK